MLFFYIFLPHLYLSISSNFDGINETFPLIPFPRIAYYFLIFGCLKTGYRFWTRKRLIKVKINNKKKELKLNLF